MKQPHCIGFVDSNDPDAFGFLNPDDMIQVVHLEPVFARGHTSDFLPLSIAQCPDEQDKDWEHFYVNTVCTYMDEMEIRSVTGSLMKPIPLSSPKPRPKDLAQLNMIWAVSEDRLDQVSQSESNADQDCPCQVVPDLSMFFLIQADLQACCQVTWFWDGDGRACYDLCNVW